jgi:hypothetical protein
MHFFDILKSREQISLEKIERELDHNSRVIYEDWNRDSLKAIRNYWENRYKVALDEIILSPKSDFDRHQTEARVAKEFLSFLDSCNTIK